MRTQDEQATGRARHVPQVIDTSRLEVLSVVGDGVQEIKHASNRVFGDGVSPRRPWCQ